EFWDDEGLVVLGLVVALRIRRVATLIQQAELASAAIGSHPVCRMSLLANVGGCACRHQRARLVLERREPFCVECQARLHLEPAAVRLALEDRISNGLN